MPFVYPSVQNLDMLSDLLAVAGPEGPINRIQIERSSTGGGTGYSNIGSVTLVSGQLEYTYFDTTGASTDWYRWYLSNAGNTYPSSANRDYSPETQPGDPSAGLLCDVYEVKQELGIAPSDDTQNELILNKIRQVSQAIEGYTERWLAPRPTSGTATYTFHTRYGWDLHIPKGIRSITTLNVATTDQPSTGGTYGTATGYYLDPPELDRTPGWPALYVRFPRAGSRFYDALHGGRITGAFGWSAVPEDIRGVAIRAAVRRVLGKGSGGASIPVGPEGTLFLLPDLSGSDRGVLDHYRRVPV